jgi:hypothetical protein
MLMEPDVGMLQMSALTDGGHYRCSLSQRQGVQNQRLVQMALEYCSVNNGIYTWAIPRLASDLM